MVFSTVYNKINLNLFAFFCLGKVNVESTIEPDGKKNINDTYIQSVTFIYFLSLVFKLRRFLCWLCPMTLASPIIEIRISHETTMQCLTNNINNNHNKAGL